ncbi:MAG: Cof-type HAD-IIB family hydrolase [Planctomycetaceae bacterium]|nr:Cof-type HAD-IIB family hydrolase [Planctomycetaceae bacterium]
MQYLALATDYDGTLALNGHVSKLTLASLDRLRQSGRKLILVTGRPLPDLRAAFPEIHLCDAVVVENGALLFWPKEDREEVLHGPPPAEFVAELLRRGVEPCSVGRVVVASWRPQEKTILEVIQAMGLEHQIIFNKRAVMVLPSGINKASGLSKVLERMNLLPAQVVGVGDAENDHAFLDMCGVAVAVANALPALKEKSDLVTVGDHGAGVSELIERLVADDLASFGTRRPRHEFVSRTAEH